MKGMKFKKLIVALLVLIVFSKSVVSYADELSEVTAISTATSEKYNVMLLIDKSGSMNATDASGLAKSAACQFIDQMRMVSNDLVDISAVTSVGIMTFDQKTDLIQPITTLESEVNADWLKAKINSIKYLKDGTGGTDLSIAAYDALEELKKSSVNGEKNIVVVFTDGYSEFQLDKDDSDEKLNKAFDLSDELGCEVYVVGLNHNNKIKEDGEREIYTLANKTQKNEGIEERRDNDTTGQWEQGNYLITDDLNDVRNFYGKIYAKILNSDLVYVENGHFMVESAGILEADVTCYSNTEITAVSITDPNGNRKVEDGKTFFVSGDSYYKVIKIANPDVGEWTVDVTSKGNDYKTYVIQFYGVEAAVTATYDDGEAYKESGYQTPYVGKVVLTPMYKGNVYTDELLKSDKTTADFTVSGNNQNVNYELRYEDGDFVGYFPVEEGVYEIEAHLLNDIVDRTVKCTLTVTNTEGLIPIDLKDIKMKNNSSVTVDVWEETGIDSLEISDAKVVGTDSICDVTDNQDGSVTISALNVGDDSILISAKDSYNRLYEITGHVEVVFAMLWYHWLLSLLGIGTLVSGGVLVWDRTRRVPGYFEVSVSMVNDEYRGESAEIDVSAPYGKHFSLERLIRELKRSIDSREEKASEGEIAISKVLSKEKKNFGKVKIALMKDKERKLYYVLKQKRNNRTIDSNLGVEVYSSNALSVRLLFKALMEGFGVEEEDDDFFGRATDYKNSKKRVSSKNKKKVRFSKNDEEDDEE